MHCELCGKLVTWLDRFGRCRECSSPPVDCFETEFWPASDEAEEAELVEVDGVPV